MCQICKIKGKLIREGLKENKCEICGLINEWNGKPLVLQLHHINGNHTDNRLENLQILCPNCHSQTDTYCGSNIVVHNKKNITIVKTVVLKYLIKQHIVLNVYTNIKEEQ